MDGKSSEWKVIFRSKSVDSDPTERVIIVSKKTGLKWDNYGGQLDN